MDLDEEEWIPANGSMNTWLQLGIMDGDESMRCTSHHDLLERHLNWVLMEQEWI